MQNICEQIEQIHSELSKMNLADKMGYIIGKQAEINSYANQLVQNRILRGSFTPEEKTAVQQLQEIQNELNVHKAEKISHHGSANGHPKYIPGHKRLHRRRLGCLRNAIIMGRNGAYSGIYDSKVINCFDMFTRIVYTEKDDKFQPIDAFGLHWRSGKIRYLYYYSRLPSNQYVCSRYRGK